MNITRVIRYIFSQYWIRFIFGLLLIMAIVMGGTKYLVDQAKIASDKIEAVQETLPPKADIRDETIQFLMGQVTELKQDKNLLAQKLVQEQERIVGYQQNIQQLTFENHELSTKLKVQDFLLRAATKENQEMERLYNEIFN